MFEADIKTQKSKIKTQNERGRTKTKNKEEDKPMRTVKLLIL
jgi:hypothetical protein